MNWDAISAIAEVIGVIAVVISLIYLAQQVRQNTSQLKQDNLLKTVRGTLDTNWYYHRDPEAFSVIRRGTQNFDSLSPQEQAHFHSILVDLSFYLHIAQQQHRAGLIEKSAPDVNQWFFLSILSTPGGQQWWELAKRTKPMPQSDIDALQSALDSAKPGDIPPITDLQPWLAAKGD
jgi:hypothetical protein